MSIRKILWHSVAPWAPTGYGQQTAIWVPQLAEMGYEVAISAFSGLSGAPLDWRGFKVYPSGVHMYGADVVRAHAKHFGADLVICLMDIWALGFDALDGLRVAAWTPVDTRPLSLRDKAVLTRYPRHRYMPMAMSRHGEKLFREAGYDCCYVPHGINTALWTPMTTRERKAIREAMHVEDKFVICINATNMDQERKGWREQLQAFARLRKRHPDAVLMAHTLPRQKGGLHLDAYAESLGLEGAIGWSDHYLLSSGQISPEEVRGTYCAADLYSGCAMGEGFGLPLAEAQSCGTPAVASNFSAMTEVCGGWLVGGDEHWIDGHGAYWLRPSIDQIARVYEKAYQRGAPYVAKRQDARIHAMQYDIDNVVPLWKAALQKIEEKLG